MNYERRFDYFSPDQEFLCCDYLLTGCCFQLDGIRACCLGTMSSPTLVSKEEIINKEISYELMVERRWELLLAFNGLNDKPTKACLTCAQMKKMKLKDINLEYIGGKYLSAGFNIQFYTQCNEKCSYCCYARENNLIKPQYNILDVLEMFRERDRLRGNQDIGFSGGEPTLLKNFDKILDYFDKYNLGFATVYTNASIYSQKLFDLLSQDKIALTVSLDTGMCSTYCRIRGKNFLPRVWENLVRYRNSGTTHLQLKYVVTEDNQTDDDMWSFIFMMGALKPNRIYLCPDFPYGDREIPESSLQFLFKLWHMLKKYIPCELSDFAPAFGDPKFVRFREQWWSFIDRTYKENTYLRDKNTNPYALQHFINPIFNNVQYEKILKSHK